MRNALLAVVVMSAGSALAAFAQLPGNIVILPTSEGPAVLAQHSRGTIAAPESFWLPTPEQVLELERRLPAYMKKHRWIFEHRGLKEYDRQYIGVVRGGRRVISGNFFPATDDPQERALLKRAGLDPDGWKTSAVRVNDGGTSYWGIVYDVEKKRFEPPDANGQA